MDSPEKQFTEKESLELITTMINKAKNAYYDTGVTAIMWGVVIAFCSLEKFAELQFNYRLPLDIYLLTIVAVIPTVFLARKEKKNRKVRSFDDNYMDYIWLGFGICIALMILVTNNIQGHLNPVMDEYNELAKGRTDWTAFQFGEYVMPLFLLLYGLPTFITGAACKFKPMLWGSIFCWACCVITIYTNIKIDLLLTAASSIMAWLIPGIVIEKEYRLYKKQQAAHNV
ncbi:MAG TPA: hypothetical protein VLJ68_10395 [Chitinophagaceae bacterium]|nr:hypothetical protein [Chitinophagaceae bacterium]